MICSSIRPPFVFFLFGASVPLTVLQYGGYKRELFEELERPSEKKVGRSITRTEIKLARFRCYRGLRAKQKTQAALRTTLSNVCGCRLNLRRVAGRVLGVVLLIASPSQTAPEHLSLPRVCGRTLESSATKASAATLIWLGVLCRGRVSTARPVSRYPEYRQN